eukprot:CAMPEP_0197180918 /NCGR_PEP_ID=MMETSP1423-20130617/5358_1 /TAXON_ID=476441 /ORGANISM="Pseudo-nitzschia heimii, Strain UNC1101" /LENGTH=466 /DNA_ID=CAMNT_0042631065 /DNA_START=357 /DNA_END=1758 /DNA_ORIENTATION=-
MHSSAGVTPGNRSSEKVFDERNKTLAGTIDRDTVDGATSRIQRIASYRLWLRKKLLFSGQPCLPFCIGRRWSKFDFLRWSLRTGAAAVSVLVVVVALRGALKLGVAAQDDPTEDRQGAHRVQSGKYLRVHQVGQQDGEEFSKRRHGDRGDGAGFLDEARVSEDGGRQKYADQGKVGEQVRPDHRLTDGIVQVTGQGHEREKPGAADGVGVRHQRGGAQTHPSLFEQPRFRPQDPPRDHRLAALVVAPAAVRNDDVRQGCYQRRRRRRRRNRRPRRFGPAVVAGRVGLRGRVHEPLFDVRREGIAQDAEGQQDDSEPRILLVVVEGVLSEAVSRRTRAQHQRRQKVQPAVGSSVADVQHGRHDHDGDELRGSEDNLGGKADVPRGCGPADIRAEDHEAEDHVRERGPDGGRQILQGLAPRDGHRQEEAVTELEKGHTVRQSLQIRERVLRPFDREIDEDHADEETAA